MVLARIYEDGQSLDFVGCSFSSQKSSFITADLQAGRYVVLIECYWQHSSAKIVVVGATGPSMPGIKRERLNGEEFRKLEYFIWREFASHHKQFKGGREVRLDDEMSRVSLRCEQADLLQQYGLLLNRWSLVKGKSCVKRGFY